MVKLLSRVGQNTGILLLVNLTGAVMGLLMAALLGRGLGEAGFGQYSLVMTWLLSLALLAEFGLSTVVTRDVAAQPEMARGYLVVSLAAKGLLALPAAAFLLIFAPGLAVTPDPAVAAALRLGTIFLYGGLVYSSFTAVFRAYQVMTPILWLTLAGQGLLLAGTGLLIWQGQPLPAIIAWAGLAQAGQCLLAGWLYQRLPAGQPATRPALGRLIRRAWPFALAGLLAALQLRANALLLAYLQGDQALGWYAAAQRFAETGRQLPGAFYAAILPAMAALAGQAGQDETLRQTLNRSRLGLLIFGLLAAAGALLLAGPVITLTYGPAYLPATIPLQVLTLSLVPGGQNSLLILYLYARGDERFVNLLTGAGIAVNLALCLVLIPRWGAAGTALALLAAEIVVYGPYRWRVGRRMEG